MKINSVVITAFIVALVVGVVGGYAAARAKYRPLLFEKDAQISRQNEMLKAMQEAEDKMAKAQIKDGVILKGDILMQAKDGNLAPLTKDVTMTDGTKVMKNGKIMMKDGSSLMLKSGEEVLMDGRIVDVLMMKY